MDAFVRRLVERLADPKRPLSRNRHFHTFESPEGRAAMKIFKRLKALKRDMDACEQAGGSCSIKTEGEADKVRVEITLQRIRSRRTVILEEAELDLLQRISG
jgi:hypothetical protein